jgi:ABC-type uncharacterized transport system permease subunit
MTELGWWGVPLAIAAGILRGSPPFLFVSLGECLTEKSGKINLGLEGTVLMGAMSAYAISYLTQDTLGEFLAPWCGVLIAGLSGAILGAIHGWLCQQPRVNDIAVGIAAIVFGSGLAFFFGKPFIQPIAPQLITIDLGNWSSLTQIQAALKISPLLILGIILAFFLQWFFSINTLGLINSCRWQ